MIHRATGLRPTNLMTYLAALGLARVVATQADSEASAHWEGHTFLLETTVADLPDFLVSHYRPMPILSPWNGGSGYGDKDKSQRIARDRVVSSGSPRLDAFSRTHRIVTEVLANGGNIDKALLVQRLRNRLPDEALPWLDAAIVLTNDDVATKRRAVFPPLLGTGGNDGRFDFSTNFHQRLAEVLPELGASIPESRHWADAALSGESVRLTAATIGQFDPLAAGGPGSSAFGAAESLTNPWLFILMLEGSVLFASSPARRLGETSSRAAMPFTVNASPDGPLPGAADEQARGELWVPVWNRPLKFVEVSHVFASARASWAGRTANEAAHMYAALHSGGLDRRVHKLVRFGLLQRNGLSFTATLLDEVDARPQPGVDLLISIAERARGFQVPTATPTGREVNLRRAYDQAELAFTRAVDSASMLRLLASETELELLAATSTVARDRVIAVRPRPASKRFIEFLNSELTASAELRVAAGLASGRLELAGSTLSLADLLLGRAPTPKNKEWEPPKVLGLGVRPLPELLSDLLGWRTSHREAAKGPTSAGGTVMDEHRYRTPWQDAHSWVTGRLSDALVEDYLKAMLALDWTWMPFATSQSDSVRLPSAALALLQPFAGGLVVSVAAGDQRRDFERGIQPGWPAKLAAGDVATVLQEAAAVLGRNQVVGYRSSREGPPPKRATVRCTAPARPDADGHRLAAALWLAPSLRPLSVIATVTELSTT